MPGQLEGHVAVVAGVSEPPLAELGLEPPLAELGLEPPLAEWLLVGQHPRHRAGE